MADQHQLARGRIAPSRKRTGEQRSRDARRAELVLGYAFPIPIRQRLDGHVEVRKQRASPRIHDLATEALLDATERVVFRNRRSQRCAAPGAINAVHTTAAPAVVRLRKLPQELVERDDVVRLSAV